MRLLNAKSLALEQFIDDDIPEYAILSHRWVEGEVSLQEWLLQDDATREKAGYRKITASCQQALKDGINHVWVDTCCIDKTSSAELSEAINAMFEWYQQAKTCYVYMNDVSSAETAQGETEKQLVQSQWFTRGWTLQELIAPHEVRFYDKTWTQFGTKSSLAGTIQDITGIDKGVLDGSKDFRDFSIACRMSWASGRKTTRVEDIAYCLMGIFEVNMPMLYGEGKRAFVRFQEEILRSSNDHSIFAWSDPDGSPDDEYNLLADHPRYFKRSGDILPATGISPALLLVTQTNNGISLQIPTVQDQVDTKGFLSCYHSSAGPESRICVYLRCIDAVGSQFRRTKAGALESAREHPILSTQIFVKQRRGPRAGNHPPAGLDTVKFLHREDEKWTWGPYIGSTWVAPQSFVIESWTPPTAEQATAGTRWRQVVDQKVYRGYKEVKHCIFALPPFLNTYAFVVTVGPRGGNQGLLVGRASNGHIGVAMAPDDLMSLAMTGETVPRNNFAMELAPLELSSSPFIVDLKHRGRITVTAERLEAGDHYEYSVFFTHVEMPGDDYLTKKYSAES